MEINGSQKKRLREALLSAFPTYKDLEMMVCDEFGENLSSIAGNGNLKHTIFELIRWAIAQGRLEELIDAAHEQNTHNPQLKSISKELGYSEGSNPKLSNDEIEPLDAGDQKVKELGGSPTHPPELISNLPIEEQSPANPAHHPTKPSVLVNLIHPLIKSVIICIIVILLFSVLINYSFNMPISAPFFSLKSSPTNDLRNIISSTNDLSSIELCDGPCALDIDRSDSSLKHLAANELQQQHHNAACAYLEWATKKDQTDAEAKIYYEDQCGSRIDGLPLQCPCINYVAAIALAKEQHIADATYTDPTIYNNGANRSIIQAVYLQQKSWNQSHKNGPPMYIFVANVGDVSDIQHASEWQQVVAQKIISLQQTGGEHHINGVVGLPQGTNTLMDLLNQNAIPMISIASLSENNSTNQQYLLSIAPSIETEMSGAAYFISENILKSQNSIHIGVFYYKSNAQYQKMASTFENMLPHSNKWDDQPYDSLPQNTSLDVEYLAEQAAGSYDAIFFAGPVNDLLTFITTLRKTDATTPVLACNTTNQSVYYYQPPLVKKSLQNVYFTAFAYHDTEKYTGRPRSPMIGEFGQTYDPESIHSGDIYTYKLPASDAILAYDAMGTFTYLMNHYGVEHLPDWQSQRAFLANNPPTLTGGIVTFMKTSNTLQVKTVLLLQIGSGGISYLDKKV